MSFNDEVKEKQKKKRSFFSTNRRG